MVRIVSSGDGKTPGGQAGAMLVDRRMSVEGVNVSLRYFWKGEKRPEYGIGAVANEALP